MCATCPDTMAQALATLTERQWLAFSLVYTQSLSIRQAALIMGISAHSVHKNYHRALVNIKGFYRRIEGNQG